MKRIGFASAAALAVLVSGCVTRTVYTSAPPPPPPPSTVVMQSPPPAVPQAAPAGDEKSTQAAAPQPVPGAAPQAAPPVVVETPPPPAPPPGYVPDYYVWDGYEYVGVYGDQYVYWTGGAWLVCPPIIITRFHGWERYHPGWHRGGSYYYNHGYYRGRGHWR